MPNLVPDASIDKERLQRPSGAKLQPQASKLSSLGSRACTSCVLKQHILDTNATMVGLLGFLFIYTIGGITLLPLLVLAFLAHAYFTLPIHDEAAQLQSRNTHKGTDITEPGDDTEAIKRAQSTLAEKFQPRTNAEAETSSGYFYCSREYVERWWEVQGKPPERATAVGSATVSAASPSVYQSMYRSIFERKPVGSPIENKGVGKPQKRGGNYFYIVLR